MSKWSYIITQKFRMIAISLFFAFDIFWKTILHRNCIHFINNTLKHVLIYADWMCNRDLMVWNFEKVSRLSILLLTHKLFHQVLYLKSTTTNKMVDVSINPVSDTRWRLWSSRITADSRNPREKSGTAFKRQLY